MWKECGCSAEVTATLKHFEEHDPTIDLLMHLLIKIASWLDSKLLNHSPSGLNHSIIIIICYSNTNTKLCQICN